MTTIDSLTSNVVGSMWKKGYCSGCCFWTDLKVEQYQFSTSRNLPTTFCTCTFFYRYLSIWSKEIRFFSFPDKMRAKTKQNRGNYQLWVHTIQYLANTSFQKGKHSSWVGINLSPPPCVMFFLFNNNKYTLHNFHTNIQCSRQCYQVKNWIKREITSTKELL